MVHKIASKYRCQMETAASLRTHLLHPVRDRTCQLLRLCEHIRGGCFHKDRNLLEIHRTIFRECLHGIQHAITMGVTTENIHRHTPCRMQAQGISCPRSDTGHQAL